MLLAARIPPLIRGARGFLKFCNKVFEVVYKLGSSLKNTRLKAGFNGLENVKLFL